MVKNMKKTGFTIAEVLVCLGVMGIIMMAAVTTIKPFDRTVKYLYTNAEINLDRAFYNAITTSAAYDPFASHPKEGDGDGSTMRSEGKDYGTKYLCESIIQYINPVDRGTSCSEERLISPEANDNEFTDDNVQFTAVNGMKFYMSGLIEANVNENGVVDEGTTPAENTNFETVRFYLVFVDVTGENGFNTIKYIPENNVENKKPKIPDIFAFAALEAGRIVPLGAPEIDTRFMTSRISCLQNDGTTRFVGSSRPYYKAKADAWKYYRGETSASTDPEDENRDTGVRLNQFTTMVDDPYTYNDTIRAIILSQASNSNIYSPKGDGSTFTDIPTGFAIDPLISKPPKEGGCACAFPADEHDNGVFETCSVHIDNYAY